MKVQKKEKVEFVLRLTKEEAIWLKDLVQYPFELRPDDPNEEDYDSSKMRQIFRDALDVEFLNLY